MTVRRIGRALTGLALVAILALLGALIVVPRVMGWVPLTILTGSMEPTIPTGSQVVIEPVVGEAAAAELQVGDVITVMPYPNDPTMVTHRIVERIDTATGVEFVTQGDANGAADQWDVTATQIRGQVRYHVPLAGYVATFLDGGQKASGIILAAGGLGLYAAAQLLGAARDRRRAGEDAIETIDVAVLAPATTDRHEQADSAAEPADDELVEVAAPAALDARRTARHRSMTMKGAAPAALDARRTARHRATTTEQSSSARGAA